MRARRLLPLALLLLALAVWLVLRERPAPEPGIDPAAALGDYDLAGYERALGPRAFQFPEDHGPHPGFRNEWWYFTGNLQAADGRPYGYQLTLFRVQLAARPATSVSAWRASDLYMAHLALGDLAGGRFRAAEHFERAALGLAGASSAPTAVWAGPVRATHEPASDSWRLEARLEGMALDLTLQPGKPVVLQGERGLSRKGANPGNASYYYSLTRLPTQGTLDLGEGAIRVQGASWFDREWSSSALEAGQVGWDWFALQLDDGRELMYYQLRAEDGRPGAYSAGVLVGPEGTTRPLRAGEVQLEVEQTWRSPRSGVRYPAGWRVRVPAAGVDLRVEPALADQELRLSVRYWEGAVRVFDAAGAPAGRGYVELVGYR